MTDLAKIIAKLKKLDKLATPGPWEHNLNGHINENGKSVASVYRLGWRALKQVAWDNITSKTWKGRPEADAALIVALRNALPELLQELVRLAVLFEERDSAADEWKIRAEQAEARLALKKAAERDVSLKQSADLAPCSFLKQMALREHERHVSAAWKYYAKLARTERDWLWKYLTGLEAAPPNQCDECSFEEPPGGSCEACRLDFLRENLEKKYVPEFNAFTANR